MRRPRLEPMLVVAAIVSAAICTLAPGSAWFRVPFAVALLLVIPGLTLALAIVPRVREDRVRLVSLTVGLSLVVGVVGGVEMSAASVLSVWSWSALALAVTALASYVAARRRPASRPARPAVRRTSLARRGAPAAAALAALVVLGVAIGVARTPFPVPDDRGFTSLSITPAPGGADAVVVRVASAEADTKDFVLALAIPGRAVDRQTFSIAPGETEEFAASVDPGVAGRVTAALAEVETPEIVYRRVRLGLPLPGPAPVPSRPEAG